MRHGQCVPQYDACGMGGMDDACGMYGMNGMCGAYRRFKDGKTASGDRGRKRGSG